VPSHWNLLVSAIPYLMAGYVKENILKRRLKIFHRVDLSVFSPDRIDNIVESFVAMNNYP
jgi:hypothetical protein